MPLKPTVKIGDLDKTIAAALKNFPPVHLPANKPPLINGIIIDEGLSKGAIDKVAKGIIAQFDNAAGAKLTKVVSPLPGGKILVGFQIQSL